MESDGKNSNFLDKLEDVKYAKSLKGTFHIKECLSAMEQRLVEAVKEFKDFVRQNL